MNTIPEISFNRTWLFVWGNINRIGGTEKRMFNLMQTMSAAGYKVFNFVSSSDSKSIFANELLSLETEALFSNSPLLLDSYISKIKPDVIWTFGLRSSLICRGHLLVHRKRPILLMARNGLDHDWNPLWHLLDRITSKLVDFYVANSQSVQDHLVANGISRNKIKILPSILAEQWFKPSTSGHPRSGIAMIGNRRKEKNHELGIKAFLESEVDCLLTIFTDNYEALSKFIENYPIELQQRIRVVVNFQMTPEAYDNFAILLHPSLSESLPMVILEGLSRNCYIIASRTGEIEHIQKESDFFQIVDPQDINGFIFAIKKAVMLNEQGITPKQQFFTASAAEYLESLIEITNSRIFTHNTGI